MNKSMHRQGFGLLQVGIVLLALSTAAIHLFLGLSSSDPTTMVMFTLNGLGYIGLLAAMYLRVPVLYKYPRLVRFLFVGYTLLTILLWVIMGERTTIGYSATTIEALLVILLFMEKP